MKFILILQLLHAINTLKYQILYILIKVTFTILFYVFHTKLIWNTCGEILYTLINLIFIALLYRIVFCIIDVHNI